MHDLPFLDLPPLDTVRGTVRLPGSKSISNRVLLLAGLSEGRTRVHDLLDSDDTRVMLEALATLGCTITREGPSTVAIDGLGDAGPRRAQADLFLGNAGTAMRPLAAALAVTALGRPDTDWRLHGVPRMHERPIGDLVDGLRPLGCDIRYEGRDGFPPLHIRGGVTAAAAPADTPIRVRGDVSSQFLTALLMALPMRTAGGPVVIEVDGELISKPYIDITLNLLARFGIAVHREGWRRFVLPQGSRYRSPGEIRVEGDASSASYFVAAGAIGAVDAPLRIEGVGLGSIQGDVAFVDAARAMGADVTLGDGHILARRGAWPLRAVDLDCNAIPDAAMTLAVMALYADGPTTLRGIASWKVKETDRIAAMAAELTRLGATVDAGDDRITVTPPSVWRPAAIHTYDDHRVAMCFSLAAFNPLARPAPAPAVPVRILDPRCVAKTFPGYFDAFLGCVGADPAAVPVITVDGPTASGKGTLASAVARALGYHHLDSGALYRAVALASIEGGVAADDVPALVVIARGLDLRFDGDAVLRDGVDIADALRHEDVGIRASQVSAQPELRRALVQRQLDARRPPGLVADGRDMGTVIFPDADLKVFLTASAATRAERRHKQLISKGFSATLPALLADLEARDERDRNRADSPLRAAGDAMSLDNSTLSIEASVERVLSWWAHRRPFG